MLVLEIQLFDHANGRNVHKAHTHTAMPHSLIMPVASSCPISSMQSPQLQGSPRVLLLLLRYLLDPGVAPSASHPRRRHGQAHRLQLGLQPAQSLVQVLASLRHETPHQAQQLAPDRFPPRPCCRSPSHRHRPNGYVFRIVSGIPLVREEPLPERRQEHCHSRPCIPLSPLSTRSGSLVRQPEE